MFQYKIVIFLIVALLGISVFNTNAISLSATEYGNDSSLVRALNKPTTGAACPTASTCNGRNCCRWYCPTGTFCWVVNNGEPVCAATAADILNGVAAMPCSTEACRTACVISSLYCAATPCTTYAAGGFTLCDFGFV